MTQDQWNVVDQYINELLVPSDPALDSALTESADAGLPSIAVAPNQGKLLHLLARAIGARNILEIGTLGGYSTIWLARALPAGGRLVTLEAELKYADVARVNIGRAGLSGIVELRVGRALDTLPELASEKRGPFDLVFIDADSNDPSVQGVRRFNELVAAEPRVSATAIQTVGSKGWDGLAMVLVTEDCG